MMAQLKNVILKFDRYEQYQAIAHANKKVENANLKGLYHALTLYTCVFENLVRARKTKDAIKQIKPKAYNVSFFSLSARMKFIRQRYRPVVLLDKDAVPFFSSNQHFTLSTLKYHESSNDKHIFQSRNFIEQMVGF